MLQATLKFFFSAPAAGCAIRIAPRRQLRIAAARRMYSPIKRLRCKAYAALFESYCCDQATQGAPFGGAVNLTCSVLEHFGAQDGTITVVYRMQSEQD